MENGKFVREALIVKLHEWKNDPEHGMPEHDTPVYDDTLHCGNLKCICNQEKAPAKFRRSEDGTLRCWYCDAKVR